MKTTGAKLFLLFLMVWTHAGAQSFKWQAGIDQVNKSGFYKIALSPPLVSKTENTDLADIRIFQGEHEIAYLIRETADSIYLKDTTGLKLQHYTAIPAPSVTVKEDKAGQRTIVKITFREAYQVDKLILNLGGFRFYRRTAWLSDTDPLIRNKNNRYQQDRLLNFTISSGNTPVVEIPERNRYKLLFLIIDNEDNAPLLIKNIRAFQKNTELIAYLEKDKRYVMKIGRQNMALPRYDLTYFNDSISNAIPFIKVPEIKRIPDRDPVKHSVFAGKSWLWAAIGLLIFFLGYLSYKMVKDMQSKKQVH